jgi:glycosyltransferase involved in cell wall biosynthesis
MTAIPEVSVVMSVYNGERYLESGIRCILDQADVNIEFIVVNDGSTDATSQILKERSAADPRLRVIHQANAGLTKSLILGCSFARGRYIARQDSDDLSMPGRLRNQREFLDRNPDVAMVSSWAEVIGPCDEPLLTYKRPADADEATELLMRKRVGPPGHGSVMFRRDAYERVGGYRALFYYAQDSDLWLRMGMVGKIAYLQAVYYQYRIAADSISGRMHPAKIPYARLISELHAARVRGESEGPIIDRANLQPEVTDSALRDSEDATLYFIARCLFARRDARANRYVRECLRKNRRNLRAWCLFPLAEGLALIGSQKGQT